MSAFCGAKKKFYDATDSRNIIDCRAAIKLHCALGVEAFRAQDVKT